MVAVGLLGIACVAMVGGVLIKAALDELHGVDEVGF